MYGRITLDPQINMVRTNQASHTADVSRLLQGASMKDNCNIYEVQGSPSDTG